MKALSPILLLIAGVAFQSKTFADNGSLEPYIDQLRQNIKEKDAGKPDRNSLDPDASYINSIKQKLTPVPEESYIDQLKKNDPDRYKQPEPQSFIEKQQSTLPAKESGGAIQAVTEGRSDLKMKREGPISGAFGFRYGVALARSVDVVNQAAAGGAKFADLYSQNYAPDLSVFYEYQPFHSEWFGNIGLVGSAGFAYYYGNGLFQFAPPNPITGGSFALQSHTFFQFFNVPVSLGVNYRFNLFRIIRPFVQGEATIIGYLEQRNDGRPSNKGFSFGATVSGGVSILMDWFSKEAAWDLYSGFSVKHYYLTVEYEQLIPIGGNDVNIALSGALAGFTFEF